MFSRSHKCTKITIQNKLTYNTQVFAICKLKKEHKCRHLEQLHTGIHVTKHQQKPAMNYSHPVMM